MRSALPIFAVVFIGIFGLNPAVVAAPEAEKSTLVDASWEAYQAGDYESAANGFRHLARQGVIKAQTNLGYMYAVGKGVKADLIESALWFRMAAEQGHTGAQNTIGLFYYNGEGVEKDIVAAHAWFTLAASAGDLQAPDYQVLSERQMTPKQLEDSHTLAKKLYRKYGENKNLW
ncbi:MAG: TPR repeat protein [Gammaproteobacteria bacterium]|jgi:TPR repeat protein